MGIRFWGLAIQHPFWDFDYDGHAGFGDVILLCTAITAIIAAIVALAKAVVWVRRKNRERFAHAVCTVMEPRLQAIESELKPNGGASLRDQVDNLTNTMNEVLEAVTSNQ